MKPVTGSILLIAGTVLMAGALAYGFLVGNGWSEVSQLVTYPWFNVSLVDVYVGFALFCAWIWTRERSAIIAWIWIIAVMLLGNLVACVYALLALRKATNPRQFWMGAQ